MYIAVGLNFYLGSIYLSSPSFAFIIFLLALSISCTLFLFPLSNFPSCSIPQFPFFRLFLPCRKPGILYEKNSEILDCCRWALAHSGVLKLFGNVRNVTFRPSGGAATPLTTASPFVVISKQVVIVVVVFVIELQLYLVTEWLSIILCIKYLFYCVQSESIYVYIAHCCCRPSVQSWCV